MRSEQWSVVPTDGTRRRHRTDHPTGPRRRHRSPGPCGMVWLIARADARPPTRRMSSNRPTSSNLASSNPSSSTLNPPNPARRRFSLNHPTSSNPASSSLAHVEPTQPGPEEEEEEEDNNGVQNFFEQISTVFNSPPVTLFTSNTDDLELVALDRLDTVLGRCGIFGCREASSKGAFEDEPRRRPKVRTRGESIIHSGLTLEPRGGDPLPVRSAGGKGHGEEIEDVANLLRQGDPVSTDHVMATFIEKQQKSSAEEVQRGPEPGREPGSRRSEVLHPGDDQLSAPSSGVLKYRLHSFSSDEEDVVREAESENDF